MAKPNATFEYLDDYEKTDALDPCDPMMGLAPSFVAKQFDWGDYYGD